MVQFHKTPLAAVVLDLSTLRNIKSQMYALPSKSREKKEEYKCQPLGSQNPSAINVAKNVSRSLAVV